jgi:acyl-CoA synthetase (AMP-forming)/AMP-acid ligase II
MASPYELAADESVALIDGETGVAWTRQRLATAVGAVAGTLRSDRKELVFCACDRDVGSVVGYLAAVAAGHAVALTDRNLHEDLAATLVERYQPRFMLEADGAEVRSTRRDAPADAPAIDPELTVLLSTSGTTGSPRFVRLARRNLEANAASIAEYLEIDARERAIASLPIHYSYGLSVLNSHLAAGASIVLTRESVIRPGFWEQAATHEATSFAGVPYTYAMLDRTGLLRTRAPDTLRTLTQAGGRLAPEAIVALHELMAARGGRMFVMYGQTEATARIAYVPPDRLPEKAATIGVPIPGGELRVDDGELVYRGPNVMMGYAENRADLARGDDLGGELRTGDLGRVDDDGFFVITGRSARIAKVFGLRVNLDEVESAARRFGAVAAVDGGDAVRLFVEGGGVDEREVRTHLADLMHVNSRAFDVHAIERLPTRGSGKIDYTALAKRDAG